ncbi:hypothetical protein ACHAW6_006083 [Cyclotella cf. meneghiniana]
MYTGNNSQVPAWVYCLHPHGPPSFLPFMNKTFSHNGTSILYSIDDLLAMCLEFGSLLQVLLGTNYSGTCSAPPCNDNTMQQWYKLQWTFSARTTVVNFMDLSITIHPTGNIVTTMFEKPLNLYLFIPPHSVHPCGLIKGLIYGSILQIHCPCSDQQDIKARVHDLFYQFLAWGDMRTCPIPILSLRYNKLKPYFTESVQ